MLVLWEVLCLLCSHWSIKSISHLEPHTIFLDAAFFPYFLVLQTWLRLYKGCWYVIDEVINVLTQENRLVKRSSHGRSMFSLDAIMWLEKKTCICLQTSYNQNALLPTRMLLIQGWHAFKGCYMTPWLEHCSFTLCVDLWKEFIKSLHIS